MRNHIKAVCAIMALGLALQACDVNINTSNSSSLPPIALTITAQAAILQQGNQPPANGNAPAASANLAAEASPNSPAATATNTAGAPNTPASNAPAQGGPVTVKVSVETNCRSGPGLIYNSMYSMPVSAVAEVIGKNTITNYWIIKIPNGGGATCWLWGQYATLTGDPASLVEYATPTPKATATATATPTATPPATPLAPSKSAGHNVVCRPGRWHNHVYRNHDVDG